MSGLQADELDEHDSPTSAIRLRLNAAKPRIVPPRLFVEPLLRRVLDEGDAILRGEDEMVVQAEIPGDGTKVLREKM